MFKKTFRTSTTVRRSTTAGIRLPKLTSTLPKLTSIQITSDKYRRCVDPTEVDSMGRTSLHHSVLQSVDSDFLLIEALQAGCDVNAVDKFGRCAIHYAAKRGYVKCLRRLITCGASLDVLSKDGMSPLMEAVKKSQLEATKILVQAGANVNLRNEEKGETAIHYAACSSDFECVEVLVQAKANLNAQDLAGNTALILGVKRSDEKVLKSLISAKVSLDRVDSDGRTALHYAALSNLPICAGMLIEAGASLDILDKKNNTPFVSCIRSNSVDVLPILMDAGCDRTSIDGLMGTAVSLASVLGHAASVQVLIEYGEDPDEAGYFGMTPIMLAAYESHADTVAALLKNGASPNAKGRIGCSPMRPALTNVISSNEGRRHDIIIMLIRSGIELNIRHNGRGLFVGCTNGNNSPLSFAISVGYLSAVRILLIAGSYVPLKEVLDWMNSLNLWRLYDVSPLKKLLHEWVSEPRSLRHACRSVIRGNLRKYKMDEAIDLLPIARSMKRYVNFEELDYVEIEKLPIKEGANSSMLMSMSMSPCGIRITEGSILTFINQTDASRPIPTM